MLSAVLIVYLFYNWQLKMRNEGFKRNNVNLPTYN